MKNRQLLISLCLLLLAVLAISGVLWTQDPGFNGDQDGKTRSGKLFKRGTPAPQERLVDMRPLQTARRMAALASTPEELEFAHEAEKLANHSVDLAFAEALRRAAENPPKLSPELKALSDAKDKAEETVEADEARIQQLEKQLAAARESQKDDLEDQLDVAKAQLELDQDELDDASDDLVRAGGDPQAKIRKLKEVHDAVDKELPPTTSLNQTVVPLSSATIARCKAWITSRHKVALLQTAQQEAIAKAQRLTNKRVEVQQRMNKERQDREAIKRSASGFAEKGAADRSETSRELAQSTLASLKRFKDDQRALGSLGKRIQDQQELGEVYGNWIGVAFAQERAALHAFLKSVASILCTVLVVYLLGWLIDAIFGRVSQEKLRMGTARTVLKLLVQIIGIIVIIFVLLGVPAQITTVLGLAGAGLTVAMKDFIVSFFGWFVLMGRNGIRVGDWVEIKGVGGEVAEIGLFRTVLIETGDWNDSGHPTGRRVAFSNSFAIEGHYFNFTTSGQWMWDELQMLIPAGRDPYPIIDGVQKLVEKETETNARLAEREWQSETSRYRVQSFSALPGINVVPSSDGVQIRVRYITRAYERHSTRRDLNQALIQLMHGKRQDESTEKNNES